MDLSDVLADNGIECDILVVGDLRIFNDHHFETIVGQIYSALITKTPEFMLDDPKLRDNAIWLAKQLLNQIRNGR